MIRIQSRVCRSCLAVAIAGLSTGCANQRAATTDGTSYETISSAPTRDNEVARKEHARALILLEKNNLADAESTLKRALAADVTFGPAHNTLGTVYYRRGNYYLAAWEFQYAAKVMPSQPEPQNNLGLVFESTNKLTEAIAAYDRAIALEPDNPEFVGNAVRARIRRGDPSRDVQPLLKKLLTVDSRPSWVEWARRTLRKMELQGLRDEVPGVATP